MKKSIVQQDMNCCYFCGATRDLERHHIFGGAYRKKSEKLGLTVRLCHNCHNEPPGGVHHNAAQMLILHQVGQQAAQEKYEWNTDAFIQEFGKNYI